MWAAVWNSQGGIDGEPVSPEQAFPSLADVFGDAGGPDAFVSAIKGRGARDMRGA